MIFLSKLIRFHRKFIGTIKSRYLISKIRDIDRPYTDLLVDAIWETVRNKVSPQEKELIDRIENKRKELLGSEEVITIIDYGPVSADLIKSEEEIRDGTLMVKSVSEACKASKGYRGCLLLFKIIRKTNPSICLELGSCMGISASYQSAALKMNNNGKLVTMEGSDSLSLLAEKVLSDLGLNNTSVVCGRFHNNLETVLANNQPVSYAFIDGHHDEVATVEYFEKIQKYLSDTSVLVFDDIDWSEGMRNAWRAIKENKNVKISIRRGNMGICVMNKGIKGNYSYELPV